MFGIQTRTLAAAVVAVLTSPMALMAQWGMASDCSCYSPQYVPAPAPVVTSACQCLQPVTQMVSQQMQVTEYKAAQRVEKRPVTKYRTVAKPVTAYRQVMETQTVDVPAVTYQTVTEMVPRTINKSRWVTSVQPVTKMASCQYDSRPGMLGAMNRMGYSMRTAFQPNYTTHRQFVPQVCQCNVPVQRQVAVQTTRKVSYNVAKMVAYQTTQQVAEAYTDYENVTVTTMEPVTVTKTVSVPVTRMAVIDPYTGMAVAPSGTQTASEPEKEPTKAAEGNPAPSDGTYKSSSAPKKTFQPVASRTKSKPKTKSAIKPSAQPVVAKSASGWKARTPAAGETMNPKTASAKVASSTNVVNR